VISCSAERETFMWDIATGKEIWPRIKQRGKILTIDVFDKEKTIFTSSDDGELRFWQIPTKNTTY